MYDDLETIPFYVSMIKMLTYSLFVNQDEQLINMDLTNTPLHTLLVETFRTFLIIVTINRETVRKIVYTIKNLKTRLLKY